MPKQHARLRKLERRAAPAKVEAFAILVQAFAILDTELEQQRELTPDTPVWYWINGERVDCTKAEFERLYPQGELTVYKIVFAEKPQGGTLSESEELEV